MLAIAFFVAWTLPTTIFQVWPSFVRDKTIPEWLAERRWPGMSAQVYTGLTAMFFLVLLALLVALIITSRRSQQQGETEPAHVGEYSGGWIHTIVDYQRRGLRKYVLVEKCEINPSPLVDGKRYFELTFHVRNYSMFYVSIPMAKYDPVKGTIRFKGDPISGDAKLTENQVTNLEPYGRNYFKVWQWVNNPDETKEIPATLEKVGNLFDFSETVIPIKADRFPDDSAAKLDLTRGMQNADLENKIVELKNANTQLSREIALRQEQANYISVLYVALGACYQAYNQSERKEMLSKESFGDLKKRISYALSCRPNEPRAMFDFYDELPPMLDSPDEQKEWLDSQCFMLRALLREQGQEVSGYVQNEGSTPTS